MTSKDTSPGQRSSEDRGAQALAHDRSAEIFERHAVLLDRFGAHRSAKTERHHAEGERDAAETVRQSLTRQPRRAQRELSHRR